ncbi:MAG: heavy-metal-associated domain-containing protein [Dysgonamonadaceae bacterium]|jgi:copper chaperone CopZ|nr:heavy-metal-associated domain-containing protein [Dysgonamonadaceae bacterium]
MKTTKFFVCLMAMCMAVNPGFAQDKKEGKKKKTAEVTFVVNMVCDNCKAKIERHLAWEKGVKDLKVDLDKKTVKVKYDTSKTDEDTLKKFLETLEYTCERVGESGESGGFVVKE